MIYVGTLKKRHLIINVIYNKKTSYKLEGIYFNTNMDFYSHIKQYERFLYTEDKTVLEKYT